MTWFCVRYSGQTYVENLTGGDEKIMSGLGFHGYATQLQAQANCNSANALQMMVASNILAGHPTGGVNTPGAPAAANIAQGAGASVNPLTDIGDFFHRLTEGSTWVRVAEVAGGLLLVYLGLKASMTPGGMNVASQTAGKTAKRVVTGLTPTARAARTVTQHKKRVKAAQTRQQAIAIRKKRSQFGRRELYGTRNTPGRHRRISRHS